MTKAKKTRYRVSFDRTVMISSSILIEAKSEDEARERFEEMLSDLGAQECKEVRLLENEEPQSRLESVLRMFPVEEEVDVTDVSPA